jgi:uncharacterized protein (TIGR02466 family)
MSMASNPLQLLEEFQQVSIDWKPSPSSNDRHLLSKGTCYTDFIDVNSMHLVARELDRHVQLYLKELRAPVYPYQRGSWISGYNRDDYSGTHDHGTSDISGCYYYRTTGKDGNIFFERPTSSHTTFVMSNLGDTWELPAREGMILLFPGWLRHGVTTNTTDNFRQVLSFNLWFDRTQAIRDYSTNSK